MMFFFAQLEVLLFLCLNADAFHNDKAPSSRNEVVRRGNEESCRCSDLVPLLNKLITEFENMAGSVREIERQAQQTTKDLKLHGQTLKTCTAKVCPFGFEYLPEVNECVKVIFQPHSWARAGEVCRKVMPGVHLATVASAAKQQAIERYLQKEFARGESAACIIPGSLWRGGHKPVWTGGQTQDPRRCGGNYVWKTLEGIETQLNYTNWEQSQPDCPRRDSVEACLIIVNTSNYDWHDLSCDMAVCPLCEF